MISLLEILAGTKESLTLDGSYEIDKSLYENSDIKDLDKVEIKGTIKKEIDGELYIDMIAKGRMLINDSITLEEIWFPFFFKIHEKVEEISEKDKNSLDIIEFLWQNIVLEVPLRYTKVENYDKYQGDGWKLVSEGDLSNNPFRELLNNEDRSD